MMSLGKRLRDLEGVIEGESSACPACGARTDGPVSFRTAGEDEAPERSCEACGNPFRFTLDLGETLREAGGSRAIGSM